MKHRCRKCGAQKWRLLVVADGGASRGVCGHCGDEQVWQAKKNFEGARLENEVFDGEDLSHSRWAKAVVNKSSFRGSSFKNAMLAGSHFNDCDFTGADFSCQPPLFETEWKLMFCSLQNTNWVGRDSTNVQLTICKTEGSRGLPESALEALYAAILKNPKAIEPRRAWGEAMKRISPMQSELMRVQLLKRENRRTGRDTREQELASWLIINQANRSAVWAAPLAPFNLVGVVYGGGLPEGLSCDARTLLPELTRLVALAPIRQLSLHHAHGMLEGLASLPAFAKIEFLEVDGDDLVNADVIALAASPFAANLTSLHLRQSTISVDAYLALARLPKLRHVFADYTAAPLRDVYEDWGSPTTYVATALNLQLTEVLGALPWLEVEAPAPSLDDL